MGMQQQRHAILQRFHHCSPQATFHRSRVGSVVRWHGDATVEACYTTKAPPLQPTGHLPSIQGQISSKVAWGCNSRGILFYKGFTIAAHRPPSIDPGSDWWRGGMGETTVEAWYTKKDP